MNYSSRTLKGLQLSLLPTVDPCLVQNFRLKETIAPNFDESFTEKSAGGFVYVVRDTYRGLYKIGFSRTVDRRLISLQAGSPVPLTLLFYVNGNRNFEKYVHQTFAQYNTHNEWFDLSAVPQSQITSEYFLELFEKFQKERQEKSAQTLPPERRISQRNLGDAAHGWIEFHQVKRQRKNGDVWECKQAWLHWEEKGRKRSRYIPKAKYADVEQSVYELKASVEVTLKLLEKKK